MSKRVSNKKGRQRVRPARSEPKASKWGKRNSLNDMIAEQRRRLIGQ